MAAQQTKSINTRSDPAHITSKLVHLVPNLTLIIVLSIAQKIIDLGGGPK